MYLNAFIIYVILLYQCSITRPYVSGGLVAPEQLTKTDNNGCYIPLPDEDDLDSPIPSKSNSEGNSPISTEHDGYLAVEAERFFNLSCYADRVLSVTKDHLREIMVKCVDGDVVKYADELHKAREITCNNQKPKNRKKWKIMATMTPPWKRYSYEKFANKGPDDCFLYVSPKEYLVPLPYIITYRPLMLVPDLHGNVFLKHKAKFRLSCTNGRFQRADISNERDIEVSCLRGDTLLYKGKKFRFLEFKCNKIPSSRLVLTGYRCQNEQYNIATVGFQTNEKMVILYNVCFDRSTKSAMYTWYKVNTPYRDARQNVPFERPGFVKTKQLYGILDVNDLYMNQTIIVGKILKSRSQAEKYIVINKTTPFFLARGHLVAKTEFFYSFEQQATFYYENTTPQWQLFNQEIWKLVERYFRYMLANERTGKHVIVTGTYGNCKLPDINGIRRNLYLDYPKGVAVPLYIWKMDFNMNRNIGIVIIGVNHPYAGFDKTMHICKTVICPIRLRMKISPKYNGMIFCCSKVDFEAVYGKLDPIEYKKPTPKPL